MPNPARNKARAIARRHGWDPKRVKTEQDIAAVLDGGCYFDPPSGERVVKFFSKWMIHSKGVWAGEPFVLLPWERDGIVMPLFGWKRRNGSRRYRETFIEVAKKNGKTAWSGGLVIYMVCYDKEARAEVFSAAENRKQAKLVFAEAAALVRKSPALSRRLSIRDSVHQIDHPSSGSSYTALARDADSADGPSIHCAVLDEFHVQKKPDMYEVLKYGGRARRQPLIVSITTAGSDHESICYSVHEYALRVLSNDVIDWTFLPFIAAADREDDWTEEATWRKANPSLGVTMSVEEFREDCDRAMKDPRLLNNFLRRRLNIWCSAQTAWILPNDWEACGEDYALGEEHAGATAWAGLDLSSTQDLTAAVFAIREVDPNGDGDSDIIRLFPFFWIPAERIREKEEREGVPWSMWVREGYVTAIPGNVIDYPAVRADIREAAKILKIAEIAYDPWNALETALDLEKDGFTMLEHRQGLVSMNEPSKKFEGLLRSGRLRHPNNPVLNWCAENVAVWEDNNGNIRPIKPSRNSTKRIDGIVASVMASGRALLAPRPKKSVYSGRGVLTV